MLSIQELRAALANDELELHYQPKVSMITGRLCGAEVLARLRRHDGSIVPPGEFIPVAETSGLITLLTLNLFRRLVDDLELIRAKDAHLTVSFNASAQDFSGPALSEVLLGALDSSRVHPGEIEVELTETAALKAGPEVLRSLETLRRRGIMLAMDDFGTGYSSIDTLSRLPFSALKVDQGVVSRMRTSPKDATIVESSIRLAHRLHLDVVAEGIETECTFHALQRAGCAIAQGYWIARPMPLGQFLTFVKSAPQWTAGTVAFLQLAMLDHIEWRKALVDFLLQTSGCCRPLVAAAARRFEAESTDCRLGRWYYGPGRAFARHREFAALDAPHAALHACAKRIAARALDGAGSFELAPMMRELTQYSALIVELLEHLEDAVLIELLNAAATADAQSSARSRQCVGRVLLGLAGEGEKEAA